MARSPRAGIVAVLAATLAGAPAAGWWLGGTAPRPTTATVVEVLDGDTVVVRLAGGSTDTVRVLGVDTPETRHPSRPVECYGPEASAYTTRRLLGRVVELRADVEDRDRYGRRLAHVVVDGARLGDDLLREGYARLLVIPPNVGHGRTMLRLELEARRRGAGLWSACPR